MIEGSPLEQDLDPFSHVRAVQPRDGQTDRQTATPRYGIVGRNGPQRAFDAACENLFRTQSNLFDDCSSHNVKSSVRLIGSCTSQHQCLQ